VAELPDAKGGVLIRVLCQFHYGGDVGEIGYVVYVAHGAEALDGVESFEFLFGLQVRDSAAGDLIHRRVFPPTGLPAPD
jgi:hypothetical protein